VTVRRFAWALNLDAELELEHPRGGYNASERVLGQLERHGGGARLLLGPRDVEVRRGGPRLEAPEAYVGRAWCPTPQALALLRAAGVPPEPHPPVEVLRRVNHRRFAFELGGGMPEQHYVGDRPVLDALLGRDGPWLLKRPFGFAGRGQLRAFRAFSDKEQHWIDASLRAGGLVVEPLVEILLEVSLHGFVHRDGRCELGRPCVQSVTDRGVFREVRLAGAGELELEEQHALRGAGERVAEALRDAGYFGPFGVDGHRHRRRGRVGFCALGEINARYTMGFAMGFPRRPSEIGIE
jgi:hypothetical protein